MYLWLKLIHILAVILFIGNIVTGVFWHKHALRTGDARLIAHAMDGVLKSDRLFTMPGVLVIIGSGVLAAVQGGFPLLRTGWILWTLVLFGISGIVFGVRLTPLQRRMRDFAQAGGERHVRPRGLRPAVETVGFLGRGGDARAARRPRADGAETRALGCGCEAPDQGLVVRRHRVIPDQLNPAARASASTASKSRMPEPGSRARSIASKDSLLADVYCPP